LCISLECTYIYIF
jgi:hypothetical protein